MAAVQLSQEQFAELMGQLRSPGGGNAAAAATASSSRGLKNERPSIDVDTTESEWAVFDDNWSRFKRMAKLVAVDEVRDNLRQCCATQLNKRLFDVKGVATLNAASEADLLVWIKEIAVKGVHKEVHRTQFSNLRQKQGETINSFYGRLKSEGALCDFSQLAPATCTSNGCQCPNHGIRLSYEDDMVATQLVNGLYSSDFKVKVLADSATLTTLDAKKERLLTLEKSEMSLSSLDGNDAISNYTGTGDRRSDRRDKQWNRKREKQQSKLKGRTEGGDTGAAAAGGTCPVCKNKHPQCEKCNGYHKCTTKCNSCHAMGHIRNCCPTAAAARIEVEEEILFQFCVVAEEPLDVSPPDKSLSTTMPGDEMTVVPTEFIQQTCTSLSISAELLTHMEWINERFQKRKPQDAPYLKVSCKLLVTIHASYGKVVPQTDQEKPSHVVDGLADTGAQVCTAGSDLLTVFNVSEDDLVPTILGVKGVTHSPVTVLGALFLEVSASGMRTKQIVYICRGARSLILSEKALKDLGVLPANFPSAGMFKDSTIQGLPPVEDAYVEVSSIVLNTCGCPLRTDLPPIPANIPVEKPEQNRKMLSKWILNFYKTSAFNVCPHQLIPAMAGPEMIIVTEQGAEPVASHSPIPVPHHWKRKVKGLIDNNVSLGVLEPVPAGIPTTWCSRMLTTPKKSGEPRIVIDLQPLNAVSKRETHHTASPWNLACSIPKGVKKSILDASNGYHSIPLALESRDKTTFLTEYGRYRYKRAPQGYTGSGDAYTKRFDDITVGVKDVVRCIDDSCLWKPTVEESFWHLLNYIDLCGRNGVIFNPEKFAFAEDIVEFAGFDVTLDAIKPCLKMTKAISEFPVPTTLKQLRGWFGIVNQVAYAFAQSKVMHPFRELLQKNHKFYWDNTLNDLFAKSKADILCRVEDGVKMFDLLRKTCLATDWSKTGVGFFLLQRYCKCVADEKAPTCGPNHWKLVFAGSRFLKDPETRYSPIEGEALAVVFALEQTRMFVLGCSDLLLAVDHKPLVPILNNRRLDLIKNPRLLRFREKTLMYRFHAHHIPGPLNFAADATSRYPSMEARSFLTTLADMSDGDLLESEADELHIAMINAVRIYDDEVVTWDRVKTAASKDDVSMYLCDAIESGFPVKKSEAPECLRTYYKLKDELYTLDGVPFLNGRMYIPKSLRRDVLSTLHSAHQGPAGMKASVRHRFWWLGMDSDIEQVRAQCKDCNNSAPSNHKEPLAPLPEPEYPWQLAVTDYFEVAAVNYLVIADRYTGWPELFRQNGKAITLVRTCRNLFAQFGVPEEIASDGGGPYKSFEWLQFLLQWGIYHRKSSANYPQSNGRAELAVKTCKRLLQSNTDGSGNIDTARVTKALLQYRNTPVAGVGMSPAYMLFGRPLRDALPSNPEKRVMSYAQKYGERSDVWNEIQAGRELANSRKQAKLVERYDEHTRPLEPLSVGDSVSIQNRSGPKPLRWDRTGRVVERLENRQYLVKSDGSGRVLLRTRLHLRKIEPSTRDMSAYDVHRPVGNMPNRSGDSPDSNHSQEPLLIPGTLGNGTRIIDPIEPPEVVQSDPMPTVPPPTQILEPAPVPRDTVRRGLRERNAPKRLEPVMHGKRHEEITLCNEDLCNEQWSG